MKTARAVAFAGHNKQGGLVPLTVAQVKADIARQERLLAEMREALWQAQLAEKMKS